MVNVLKHVHPRVVDPGRSDPPRSGLSHASRRAWASLGHRNHPSSWMSLSSSMEEGPCESFHLESVFYVSEGTPRRSKRRDLSTVEFKRVISSDGFVRALTAQLLPGGWDQSWVFIGMTDAEVGSPVLLPPDAKSLLIYKDTDAGKDGRQEEKGTTEDEMARWHH